MIHWTGRFITHAPPDPHGWWWHVFYDWQTLWAGGAALAAALIALGVSRGQLNAAREQLLETRRQADRDRQGRLRAARANLPGALSGICAYATAVAHQLKQAWSLLTQIDRTVVGDYPSFPTASLSVLGAVVEYTEDGPVAKRIESILREAQVLDARTRALAQGESTNTGYLAACLEQAASLHARAESLFDYARGHEPSVAAIPLWDRTLTAFTIFGMTGDMFGEVFDIAKASRDRGEQPGEADERGSY